MQAPAAAPAQLPAGHAAQAPEPAAALVPGRHATQVALEVAALAALAVPLGQLVQEADPGAAA